MKHLARKAGLLFAVFFIATMSSAQAGAVRYDEVLALASVAGQSGRPSVDLRLRQSNQQVSLGSRQTATTNGVEQGGKGAAPDGSGAAGSQASLTGTEIALPQTGQQTNVETVELGEVQGTICDCGDIPAIGGGFPKWPLLGLAAIPFLFINHDKTPPADVFPTPTPTVTPPPTTVPEPATLFLLGTGLVAVSARARRARRSNAEAAREV